MKKYRTAIVYDWIDKWGGVERLLLILQSMLPEAKLFTSHFDKTTAPWANNIDITASFMQKIPAVIRKSRILSLPFYPLAFESLDFKGFDLVISVSSSFAKAIITRPETHHINICLTPTRYLWLYSELYATAGVKDIVTRPYINYLKKWDMVASQRPDHIISISNTVKMRVKEIYQRDSEVIYPPFDIDYWSSIKLQISNYKFQNKFKIQNLKFYLVVSRLEPYKRIDLAVEVFRKIPEKQLVIIGKGSQLNNLKSKSPSNVIFMQDLSDSELAEMYSNAAALIMPQEEDFGYTALEAQFFGCPVIAYKHGGATETVIDDKTGIFFATQNEKDLTQAVTKYDTIRASLKETTKTFGLSQCHIFSKEQFERRFINYVSRFKVHVS